MMSMLKTEQSEFDKTFDKMMNHICDNKCFVSRDENVTAEQLELICENCEVGAYYNRLSAEHAKVNNFENSQSAKLLQKYSSITMCNECKWIGCEQITKIHYCRLGAGLMVEINPQLDGCSKGVKR